MGPTGGRGIGVSLHGGRRCRGILARQEYSQGEHKNQTLPYHRRTSIRFASVHEDHLPYLQLVPRTQAIEVYSRGKARRIILRFVVPCFYITIHEHSRLLAKHVENGERDV